MLAEIGFVTVAVVALQCPTSHHVSQAVEITRTNRPGAQSVPTLSKRSMMCGGPGNGGIERFARSHRSALSQFRGSSPWIVIPPESNAMVALKRASAAEIGRSSVSIWPPAAMQ